MRGSLERGYPAFFLGPWELRLINRFAQVPAAAADVARRRTVS